MEDDFEDDDLDLTYVRVEDDPPSPPTEMALRGGEVERVTTNLCLH